MPRPSSSSHFRGCVHGLRRPCSHTCIRRQRRGAVGPAARRTARRVRSSSRQRRSLPSPSPPTLTGDGCPLVCGLAWCGGGVATRAPRASPRQHHSRHHQSLHLQWPSRRRPQSRRHQHRRSLRRRLTTWPRSPLTPRRTPRAASGMRTNSRRRARSLGVAALAQAPRPRRPALPRLRAACATRKRSPRRPHPIQRCPRGRQRWQQPRPQRWSRARRTRGTRAAKARMGPTRDPLPPWAARIPPSRPRRRKAARRTRVTMLTTRDGPKWSRIARRRVGRHHHQPPRPPRPPLYRPPHSSRRRRSRCKHDRRGPSKTMARRNSNRLPQLPPLQ
mmetsp:Transcript_31040/g.90185  ORF Transcript_31040/g.90185 Transcript_31040/m.90185 type:complete len:332 (-) Transcript_31040:1639-2634(-)